MVATPETLEAAERRAVVTDFAVAAKVASKLPMPARIDALTDWALDVYEGAALGSPTWDFSAGVIAAMSAVTDGDALLAQALKK